jgi:hypothetical protein
MWFVNVEGMAAEDVALASVISSLTRLLTRKQAASEKNTLVFKLDVHCYRQPDAEFANTKGETSLGQITLRMLFESRLVGDVI